MGAAFKSRLIKLEALRKRPVRVRNHVVTVDAEGRVIGQMTDCRPMMLVKDHGTDAEWEAKLRRQQSALVEEAAIPPADKSSEK